MSVSAAMTATIEASTSNEASSEGSGSAASVVLASNAVSTHTDAYVRQVAAPVTLAGKPQPACPSDPATQMVECDWTLSYPLSIPANRDDPTDWASGSRSPTPTSS